MIRVSHLTKKYGATTAVDDISFEIQQGEIVGYLGPNGAGKSTTLKMLIGLLQPTSGEISVAGYDAATELLELKRRIGYVPEEAQLYEHLTLVEHLQLIGRLYHVEEQRITEKIKGLARLFDMEAQANQRISGFSQGMRQKCLIMSAVLHNPDVLFLDEPFTRLYGMKAQCFSFGMKFRPLGKDQTRNKFKSITLKQTGYKLFNNRITLTFRQWENGKWRFDRVPYTFHKHRQWHGTLSRITLKRDACGNYWLCIITTYTDFKPLPATGKSVGADFGMKDAYLTLSTGEKKQHPQPLKHSLKKLRSLNKSLSRKIKGSNGWWRCVRQIARLYRKITNQRKDFQWQLASELCKKFDTIAIETLNLDGMKRLWGRKVSDLAFYEFVEILKYKCSKHKRLLKQVGRWTATTKPCSDCGFHNETLTLNDRQWTCPKCDSHHDRDINAAINILRAGIAVT